MTILKKYLTEMQTHRFYSIVPVAILLFCAAGCNGSVVGGFDLAVRGTIDPDSTLVEDNWMSTARNSLADHSYVSSGKIYGCSSDCGHEEYGFANALWMSATSDEQCFYSSFERVEHRNGCRAYLVALKHRIGELQQWSPTPDAVIMCVDELQMSERVLRLYQRSAERQPTKYKTPNGS
jgi:hypothetical protein